MSDGEHRFLHGFTHQLNEVLRAGAARHGYSYLAGMEDAFAPPRSLRLCDQPDPGRVGVNFFAAHPVEGLILEKLNPRNWFHNSLHPNALGHERMSEVLTEWLADPSRHQPVIATSDHADIATVEDIMGDLRFAQLRETRIGAVILPIYYRSMGGGASGSGGVVRPRAAPRPVCWSVADLSTVRSMVAAPE